MVTNSQRISTQKSRQSNKNLLPTPKAHCKTAHYCRDLFSDHWKADDPQPSIQEPSIRPFSILRDQFPGRSISSLSWSDLTATKRVDICYTPHDLESQTVHIQGSIYNLECPSVPELELHPQSPLSTSCTMPKRTIISSVGWHTVLSRCKKSAQNLYQSEHPP